MSKTPVSMLQEMMVKQGMVPDYELIHNGGGGHVNTFTYRVICDGFTATGTGRCKKEAKHEAAKAILAEIINHRNFPQLPAATTPAASPSRSPFHSVPPPKPPANVPFVNTIGELQDICAENNLTGPEYILIKDSGPPHARIFTIQCKVCRLVEEGVASTKKTAKHEAARRMVEKIKSLVKNQTNNTEKKEDFLMSSMMSSTDRDEIDCKNENAKKLYNELTQSVRKMNLGIKLAEYHIKWRDSLEIDKRNKILTELDSIKFDKNQICDDVDKFNELINEKLSTFETILSEINVRVSTNNIIAGNNYFMKSIELNTCPILTQIGMGKNNVEASWNALSQIVDTVKLLLN